jgi:hypothetical protein
LGAKNLDLAVGITAYFFVLLLGLIGTSVGLGYGLRRLAWGRPLGFGYAQVLYSGLTGAVALASAGALWWTRGITIHSVAVVVGFFLIYEARRQKFGSSQKDNTDERPTQWWSYWPLLAGAVLVYAFCAWGYVRTEAYVPFGIPVPSATFHHDHIYSARIAYFSMTSGQESDVFLLQLLDSAYAGVKPYHYLELWLANLMTVLTKGKQVTLLYLVVYPFFYWLSLIGILALWQNQQFKLAWWTAPAAVILLFLGGFTFDFYQGIPFLSGLSVFERPLISGLPKLGQVYVGLLTIILLHLQRKYLLALLVLLLLSTNYVTLFPSIALAACLASLIVLLFGFVPKNLGLRALGYAFTSGLAIPIFYLLFDTSVVGREGANARDAFGVLSNLLSISSLRIRLNIVAGGLVQLGVVYLPYLILVALYWPQWRSLVTKERIAVWLSFGLLLVTSGISWAIFYQQLNSIQLFYNISVPLINSLLFGFLAWVTNQPKNWKFWLVALLCLVSSLSLFKKITADYPLKGLPTFYADGYLKKIDQYLQTMSGNWLAGASLRHPSAYSNVFEKYVTIYTNGTYLPYLGNGGAIAISLNDLEIPLDIDPLIRQREQKAIGMGLFYRWVAKEKAAGTFRDIPTSQAAFVRHYQLRFLIVTKGVEVPATLRPMVTEEFVDGLSGERFLVLDPKK